jgi:hypothetical protein
MLCHVFLFLTLFDAVQPGDVDGSECPAGPQHAVCPHPARGHVHFNHRRIHGGNR